MASLILIPSPLEQETLGVSSKKLTELSAPAPSLVQLKQHGGTSPGWSQPHHQLPPGRWLFLCLQSLVNRGGKAISFLSVPVLLPEARFSGSRLLLTPSFPALWQPCGFTMAKKKKWSPDNYLV